MRRASLTVLLLSLLAAGACEKSTPAPAGDRAISNSLHAAARDGDLARMREVLDRGADIDALDENRVSALHEAAAFDQYEAAALLVERGADVNRRGVYGRTPLHFAVPSSGASPELLRLLVSSGADIGARDDDLLTPLHAAVQARDDDDPQADMHAKVLLELGADPNAEGPQKSTPLHLAAQWGSTRVIDLLVESGSVANTLDVQGFTPLRYTLSSQFLDAQQRLAVADTLLQAGADPNLASSVGERATALHSAAAHGYDALVPLLVSYGADLEAQDASGNTPLHAAIRFGQISTTRILLDAGSDPANRNSEGMTALDLARDHADLFHELSDLLSESSPGG